MKSFITEFVSYFVGNMSYAHFLALITFAIIGATIKLTLHVRGRDVQSPATPVKFNFRFMFLDNLPRIISSGLLVYLFIRFPAQLIPDNIYKAIPPEAEMLLSALIGFCFDYLSQRLKDKVGILQPDRRKIIGDTKD